MFENGAPPKLKILEENDDGFWCAEILQDGNISDEKVFLNKKGAPWNEDEISRIAWKCAYTHMKASFILSQNTDPDLVMSSSIMASFACELFLKALLYQSEKIKVGSKSGHDLKTLYDLLPAEVIIPIEGEIKQQMAKDEFIKKLEKMAKIFEKSRYSFEIQALEFDLSFLQTFACILNNTCISILKIPQSAM